MKLSEITDFIENNISKDLALENDFCGLKDNYVLNQDIEKIKIIMDLYPQYDNFDEKTLIITHHNPLFIPKTPTYILHSNWDIIKGGANEALAESLNLNVIGIFDNETGIGRICELKDDFNSFKEILFKKFNNIRVVGNFENIDKIAIISGFGLKNPNYIKLAKDKNINILISGDLTQETCVLAINEGISLIDLGHHNSEVPGLFKLKELFEKIDIECEVINKGEPWRILRR